MIGSLLWLIRSAAIQAVIWERLADQHGTTVAYSTLRAYVTSRRATAKTPGTS